MLKRCICVLAALAVFLLPTANAFQKGDEGEEVTQLQEMLIETGHLYGTPDGIYGGYTQKAAKAYMDAWKIDETQLIDHLTVFTEEGAYAAYRMTLSLLDDIDLLQEKLVEAGYLENASGEYDDATRLAEKTYRIASAVPEEEATLAALADVFSPMQQGDTGADVALLQSLLIEKGYTFGVADGTYGERTRKAVLKAQKALSMEQTGIADGKLMKRLLAD